MTQPKYLLKTGEGVVQAAGFSATHTEVREKARLVDGFLMPGKPTGKFDHSTILFYPISRGAKNRYGHGVSGAYARRVPASAVGVKTVLRRIREQEAEKIEEVDVTIALAEAQLKMLRNARAKLLSEAWSKANVVRLNEINVMER